MQRPVEKEWKYFNEGQEHFILQYVGQRKELIGHVLILQKQYEAYNGKELHDISGGLRLQQLMRNSHIALFTSIPALAPFLLQERQLSLEGISRQEFIEIVHNIIAARPQGPKKQRKRTKISPHTPLVLGRNLYYDRHLPQRANTVWLEFKLKSDIPDTYTPKWLEELTTKHGVNQGWLEKAILQSPQVERTKEFKKQLRENYEVTNKLPPLDMFAYQSKHFQKLSRVLKYSHGPQLPISEEEFDRVVNQALRRSGLIRTVLLMQLLFAKPMWIFKQHDLLTLAEKDPDLQAHLKDITHRLSQELVQLGEQYVQGSHLSMNTIFEAAPREDVLEQFFRALVSMTWRDVSVIVQVGLVPEERSSGLQDNPGQATYKERVNEHWWATVKLTLLDYELKSVCRIPYYIERQQTMAGVYIKHKLAEGKGNNKC